MTDTVKVQQNPGGGVSRLCTAQGLAYKAFRRRYSPDSFVLSLVASGFYDTAPWELTFVVVSGSPNKYQLMETVPSHFFHLTTFYTPCFCSHYGLEQLANEITIVDSFGEHVVHVEAFGG
jgi:hypothetical protein